MLLLCEKGGNDTYLYLLKKQLNIHKKLLIVITCEGLVGMK